MASRTVNFSDCIQQDLCKWFDLEHEIDLPELTDWQQTDITLVSSEIEVLTQLKEEAFLFVDGWNEMELQTSLIGPVLNLATLYSRKFRLFSQREISAEVGDIQLKGKVDGLLATGYSYPEIPFFCMNEYKKSLESPGEPMGQNLAAMLVAQVLNGNDKPVYGMYVLGRNWHFMILKGKKYAISKSFDTTSEDIFEIAKVLKKLKTIVQTYIK